MATQKRRRGRPAKYVLGHDGKPIVGLSYDKSLRQYYATGTKPKIYFGTDLNIAIAKFRIWQQHQDKEKITSMKVPDNVKQDVLTAQFQQIQELQYISQSLDRFESDGTDKAEQFNILVHIPESLKKEIVREMFATKSMVEMAEIAGMPELVRLKNIKKPETPLSLKEVGEFYLQKDKLSKDEFRKCKSTWEEFCKTINCKTIDQITKEHIHSYYDKVYNRYIKKGLSETWISGKFQRVKTIFNYSRKRGRQCVDEFNILYQYCEHLIPPNKIESGANPISRNDFHKLLKVADEKWTSILLVSLNCAFYGRDIHTLQHKHIKEVNGLTIVKFPRVKNKNTRVSVLWQDSISSIEEYFADDNRIYDIFFVKFQNET